MINAATNLADRFNTVQGQLDALQLETNNRISSTVNDVNAIAENIAKLNQEIMEAGENPPNDLLDQRDTQLSNLAELISFSKIDQPSGGVTVMVGNGLSLVAEKSVSKLNVASDPQEPEKYQIIVGDEDSNRVVSTQLAGGALGGLTRLRRTTWK